MHWIGDGVVAGTIPSRGECGIECVRRQGAVCPWKPGLDAGHQKWVHDTSMENGLGRQRHGTRPLPMDPSNSTGGCHVQMSNAAQLIFKEEGRGGQGVTPVSRFWLGPKCFPSRRAGSLKHADKKGGDPNPGIVGGTGQKKKKRGRPRIPSCILTIHLLLPPPPTPSTRFFVPPRHSFKREFSEDNS